MAAIAAATMRNGCSNCSNAGLQTRGANVREEAFETPRKIEDENEDEDEDELDRQLFTPSKRCRE